VRLAERVHGGYVTTRRVRVLAHHLAALVPQGARVLDVGCGDGLLDRELLSRRPDLSIEGIDVLVRSDAHIQVIGFDGRAIPFGDRSFDAVLFVDVLHHTDDPFAVLSEGTRVAKRTVVVKDHNLDGVLAGPALRFMDRMGNARHGVALPYNYWTKARWTEAFARLGLTVAAYRGRLGLYPSPVSWVFERSLHFAARLERFGNGKG